MTTQSRALHYLDRSQVEYAFDMTHAPRLTVDAPCEIMIETHNSRGGRLHKPEDEVTTRPNPNDKYPKSNPMTGPVGITGAEPGDSLAVEIVSIEVDPVGNRVIVGDEAGLLRDTFQVTQCNWIAFDEPPASFECTARIRYNHPGASATVTPGPAGTAAVRLHHPARAVTPGQACVFYQDDLVVGGGWIAR